MFLENLARVDAEIEPERHPVAQLYELRCATAWEAELERARRWLAGVLGPDVLAQFHVSVEIRLQDADRWRPGSPVVTTRKVYLTPIDATPVRFEVY